MNREGFQVLGQSNKALVAYEKAAEANLRGSGTEWHAAKHLESAAQICKELQRWPDTAEFGQRAAKLYVDAGKPGTGAECIGRCARWLETGNPSTSGMCFLSVNHVQLNPSYLGDKEWSRKHVAFPL
jgi:hypothetical protein